jgi:poly(U)-specific endoribonuclease
MPTGDVLTAVSTLWDLDTNRLTPGIDYTLDLQSKSAGQSHDAAMRPIFSSFSPSVWARPTFASFRALLDNYTAATGVAEVQTSRERAEQMRFVRGICATECMQHAREWLVGAGKVPGVRNDKDWYEFVDTLWFGLYKRDAAGDSSSFEHVFCGEIDDGKVKGLHSFVQVHLEEEAGRLEYKGWLPATGATWKTPDPSDEDQVVTIRFEWGGETKFASSVFVGVLPEFEIALYTILFIGGGTENKVTLGRYTVKVKIYRISGNKIGSAYPEALAGAASEVVSGSNSGTRKKVKVDEGHGKYENEHRKRQENEQESESGSGSKGSGYGPRLGPGSGGDEHGQASASSIGQAGSDGGWRPPVEGRNKGREDQKRREEGEKNEEQKDEVNEMMKNMKNAGDLGMKFAKKLGFFK